MSSFFEAFSNSFGQGASIGAQGAESGRRERLSSALRKRQEEQRAEEKALAGQLRAKQEKDQTLGIFFKAMGSENPEEVGAAAQHFGKLAAADPVQWGDYANELTTRAADAKKRRATEELLKAEQLKTEAEQNSLKLESFLQRNKSETDYYNRRGAGPAGPALPEDEPRQPTPVADPTAALFARAATGDPAAFESLKGQLSGVNLSPEQQGFYQALEKYHAANPAKPAEKAGGKVKHTRSIKRDGDGNPLVEDTYTGEVDRIPDTAGAAPAAQASAFTPDTRDVKEHKGILTEIEELHYEATRSGDDPKEVQAEAGQLLAKLKAIHKRRIAMTPAGPEQMAVAEAAAREFAQAAGRFGGGAPKGAETPSPKPQTPMKPQAPSPKGEEPMKPELLAGADKLQPVGSQMPEKADEWDNKPILGSKGKAAAVVKEMFTPSEGIKEAVGMKASPALEAEVKRRKEAEAQKDKGAREAMRKQLVASGVPNPSEELISEMLKRRK